jgi:hypothetical protein
MAGSKAITGARATGVSDQILERLDALRNGVHEAYCMATCVDYALQHKESDIDPEIAVCVQKHLVKPLDALYYAAAEIREALSGAPSDVTADDQRSDPMPD